MKEEKKEEIFVTRASLPPFEEYTAMIREIWDTHWLTNMGKFHEMLKAELKTYLSAEGLELFVNGHIALEMLLQAFELKGEVITTPFSFASTTHAIVRNGLKPVFCDIREDDATIDAEKIERLITKDTTAIVPVHVYGNLCDYEAIDRIAEKYHLKVIYDAAHAFGESVRGRDGVERSAAVLGDASMFSMHATKVYNTIEGGAVTWGRAGSAFLEERLYQLKNFGIMGKECVDYVGGNGKMNEFSAAMGLCNLRHVEDWIEARRKITERYRAQLGGVPGVRLMPLKESVRSNYAYMPVIIEGGMKQRDAAYERLCANGLCPRKYFYPCINAFGCYRESCDPEATPVAKRISESVLTLPIYPELPFEAVDRICGLLCAK